VISGNNLSLRTDTIVLHVYLVIVYILRVFSWRRTKEHLTPGDAGGVEDEKGEGEPGQDTNSQG